MIRTSAGLVLAWAVLGCDPSGAAVTAATGRRGCAANAVPEHIRTSDRQLAKTIVSGLERSETFRRVVERVGRLQGIVYIDARYLKRPQQVLPGALVHTVTKAGPYRILYVTVGPRSGDRSIVVLAHELQHAVEVLESDATTEAEIDQLFERIGAHVTTGIVETQAALDIGRAVARELSAARRP